MQLLWEDTQTQMGCQTDKKLTEMLTEEQFTQRYDFVSSLQDSGKGPSLKVF